MNYFKLQSGCLVIILYIIINYIRETVHSNFKCNLYFDLLMIFSPLAIIFPEVLISALLPTYLMLGLYIDFENPYLQKLQTHNSKLIKETFTDLDNKELQKIIYEMAKYHHEKYNGKGYPEQLKGEEIPLHARIMAIADVFDAVSQNRCYRDALPLEECFSIIEKGSGQDFDPNLTKIFLECKDEVKAHVKREFKDILFMFY